MRSTSITALRYFPFSKNSASASSASSPYDLYCASIIPMSATCSNIDTDSSASPLSIRFIALLNWSSTLLTGSFFLENLDTNGILFNNPSKNPISCSSDKCPLMNLFYHNTTSGAIKHVVCFGTLSLYSSIFFQIFFQNFYRMLNMSN